MKVKKFEKAMFSENLVVSDDGTWIGYRKTGKGPGIILLHGGMMASQNLMTLAGILSDVFSVYIPDRRGRGMSGAFGKDYGLEKECQDVAAIMKKTGAVNIFGLSSGALIALQAACNLADIQKVALYEPPLPINGADPVFWAERYEDEISRGQLAEAMVTAIKGTGDGWILSIPRIILVPLLRMAIRLDAKDKTNPTPIKDLIPTLHYDIKLVLKLKEKMIPLKNIKAKILLMGGSKSQHYLKTALDELENELPHAQRIEFAGLGHTAANNEGKPEIVAHALKDFYSDK